MGMNPSQGDIMTWAGEAAKRSEAEVEGKIKEIGCLIPLTTELINTCGEPKESLNHFTDDVFMLSN